MAKHPPKLIHTFFYKTPLHKPSCPFCGRPVNLAVPATTVTYLVHAQDGICVMDNNPKEQEITLRGKSG